METVISILMPAGYKKQAVVTTVYKSTIYPKIRDAMIFAHNLTNDMIASLPYHLCFPQFL